MTASHTVRSKRRRRSRSPTRPGKAGQQVESFEIGDEEDEGDGTKQFAVTLKMKKPPGDQSVRYFVHGRDPVWVYREEDYKRMLNMDNNPVTTSRSKSDPRRSGRPAMTRLAPGSVPDGRSTSRAAGPIWRRAGSAPETGPGPAPDPDRARGGGARGRPLGR